MARISFVVVGEKILYQTTRFLRRCKNQVVKLSQSKLQNKTINFLSYIFSTHAHILYPWVSILSISCFLETDIKEQQKYEKRTKKYKDNTVNDLHHEIKFEICVKNVIIIQLLQHFFCWGRFANCWGKFWMLMDLI